MARDIFFEVAESEAYRQKFANPLLFDAGKGREYYRESNLRKLHENYKLKSESAFHPRAQRDYRNTAIRVKQLIKHSIWLEDTCNWLMNHSKNQTAL